MKALARRLWLAVAFASMTIASASSAEAQTSPRRVVVVAVKGTADETASFESTLRELLSRLSLTMATGSAPSSVVLETVTVDLTGTFGAKVIVKTASGATVIDRTVPRGDSPGVFREQIAQAVRGAAEAELLVDEDRVAGRAPPVVEPPPAPAPTPEPAPPPPPPPVVVPPPTVVAAERPIAAPPPDRSGIAMDVSTFAGGGLIASHTSLVARVGGAIALASREGLRPSIALAALYSFPVETDQSVPLFFNNGTADLTSRTKLFSLRVLPGLGLVRAGRFGFDVQAGAGLDVITVEPVPGTLPLEDLGGSTTRIDPIFSAAATGSVTVATDVAITLTAMLDIAPLERSYVLSDNDAQKQFLSPWVVRPMLLAGLSFTAFGAGR